MIVLDRMLIGGLELGEISAEEHAAIEEELLARLKAVSGGASTRAGAGVGGRFEVEEIETIASHEDEH